jgi:DNA-binding transcriptional regulator GbsR (MarR family)
LEVKKAYSGVIKDFYKIIDSTNKENRSLEITKNILLPKLISGELDTTENRKAVLNG